ncbi:conserved hypothetical protein [Hyella patelloides LEGE 07179]|uniref:Isopropylmalate/homocitrate/citramalate synthase n=1 Tax=Hyella patelloides LEGE 07179 TaxID=945734 RepID=A0A563VSJ3_9CYAN|nr:hypothetical protein [Hyella patelloides]VEP14352.1 conserved hypothetical protein [Hyella patelloides LEGE 07179]
MINNNDKNDFLYPRSPYHGKVQPKNLVFNANLQEFAQQISYICNLETGGKLPPNEAYKQIKSLWKELKRSKKALNIGKHTSEEGKNS